MTDLRDWLKAYNIENSMGGEMAYHDSADAEQPLAFHLAGD